jgi:hypothetical protein
MNEERERAESSGVDKPAVRWSELTDVERRRLVDYFGILLEWDEQPKAKALHAAEASATSVGSSNPRKMTFLGYQDETGYAELHFADPFDGQAVEYSHTHSIFVAPKFVKQYRR